MLDSPAQPNPHRNPYYGIKTLALLAPDHAAPEIHISNASLGKTYFDSVTLLPMHAKINVETPHFYFKGFSADQSLADYHHCDRTKNEGIVHYLAKKIIQREKMIAVQVGEQPYFVQFSVVKPEYTVKKPDGNWRIDLVCQIAAPAEVKTRFGGGLCIEIVCHNHVNDEKVVMLQTLQYAALEIVLGPRMVREIEAEERDLLSHGRSLTLEIQSRWESRIHGWLRKTFKQQLLHIPGEPDPRIYRRQLASSDKSTACEEATLPSIPTSLRLEELSRVSSPQPPMVAPSLLPGSNIELVAKREPTLPSHDDTGVVNSAPTRSGQLVSRLVSFVWRSLSRLVRER